MPIRTCVAPKGTFIYGIHRPQYYVENLRTKSDIQSLGEFSDFTHHYNSINFPKENINIKNADIIYEIPNAFPFKGTTYIQKRWADEKASNLSSISLKQPTNFSWSETLSEFANQIDIPEEDVNKLWEIIPEAMQLTIATTSSDKKDLTNLAKKVCDFVYDNQGQPTGLKYYKDKKGQVRPLIKNKIVFESLVNNPDLPDIYKETMILRPGVQGNSPITGEFCKNNSHVYEYLRANSYIPWGHFAANMSNDSIRYDINSLKMEDMTGMRHLFYQRIYIILAKQLNISTNYNQRTLSNHELETLRKDIIHKLKTKEDKLTFDCNLWGWNFGFDYAPNHYRLHASHQQVHQQYAMIPRSVPTKENCYVPNIQSYACGDLVDDFIRKYYQETGNAFFDDYVKAIKANTRIDKKEDGPNDLIIYSDENVMIFVPKAQTSQWEIQIMPLKDVGNILEADPEMRSSLDKALFITARILSLLNAKLVTHIEYASRFSYKQTNQRLIIAFLPRMPESPGAFSEAQLRWINGHYPEDFAAVCRSKLPEVLETLK